MRLVRVVCYLLAGGVVSCSGGEQDALNTPEGGAGNSGGTPDGVSDSAATTPENAPGDAAHAPNESAPEIARDSSTDVVDDVVRDMAPDAAVDAPFESALDTSIDVAPDVASDVASDTVIDFAPDAAADALADRADDAAADALTDRADDAMADAPADVTSDAAADAPTGPVDVGTYTYAAVTSNGLLDPPAAAWHPGGSYALVLSNADKVFKYDPVTKTVVEVASAGSTVTWREIAFTPDGTKAVLLGNVASPTEGRLYLWDDASSTLAQMTTETFAGGSYESIAWSPDGNSAKLLAAKPNASTYIAYLWAFDVVTGRSGLKAMATSAGCQDIAWATDALGAPAVAVTCGVNGVTLFHLDGGGNFVNYTGNAGNTSRISGRPQGDYALAIGWSGARVYRYQEGSWSTGFSNPTLPGIFQVEFSTDGRRALILGGYGGDPAVGQVYEYRHDRMQQADFTDVSIPSFALPPYNADSAVGLHDVAWRPGCDGGLIVGGSNTLSSKTAYVVRFSIDNGTACAN